MTQHPEIIRALYKSKSILELHLKKEKNRNFSENAGVKWTQKEDDELISEFTSGEKITQLSKTHKRTRGSITARLAKHRLLIDTKIPR